MTKQRLSVQGVDPDAYKGVLAMEKQVRSGPLDASLRALVKIRASQINGCAFCLNMHHREAREVGESQQRLDVLSAWREVDGLFTDRERAALAMTEAVTRIADAGVPEDVWAAAAELFDEKEMVSLLLTIATINVWNRLAISTHQQPAP